MPGPRFVAQVKANGQIYTSWKSLTVRREFGDTISWFQINVSEGDAFNNTGAARLVPGIPVQIYLAGVLALTGGVTTRVADFDANSHEVIIGGRSGTGNAADSSMNVAGGNYDGYTLQQAASAALQPHSVNLKVINPSATFAKPFQFLAVNPGETVNSFIERMCLVRGAFMWDDESGNLCVGQGDPSAAAVADLQEGRNMLRGHFKLDDQDIYSAYTVNGQQPSSGDDMAVRTSQATVTDPSATSTKIKVSPAEHVVDAADATVRANMEAALSAWPSIEASVTVVGWTRPDGSLWGLMDNISVYSPSGLPNGSGKMTLGIQAITFSQIKDADGEGTTTTLELKRPELLTSTPHTNVQSDGSGGYGDGGGSPDAGQPVPPDYQGGTSTGPGGSLGHA